MVLGHNIRRPHRARSSPGLISKDGSTLIKNVLEDVRLDLVLRTFVQHVCPLLMWVLARLLSF